MNSLPISFPFATNHPSKTPVASSAQMVRLYWIDAQIRAGRYPNAHNVAAHFHITSRAAYKDRLCLRDELGAPLKTDSKHKGWYYTDPTYLLPFLALPEREAAALRRSLLAAQEYLDASAAQAVTLLLEHLSAYLPSDLAGYELVRGALQPTASSVVPAELLDTCRTATRNRQKLWMRYYAAHRDAETERTVQPYYLLHFRGETYLIAWCEWRQKFCDFYLGRVREWRLLPEDCAFVRQPDFDIEAYLRQSLHLKRGEEPVTVRAHFSPYQARWIRERQYHSSQQIEELPDKSLILTVRVAGTDEVKRWLMGYGAEVEVLEPAALRTQMRQEIETLQKKYAE